MKYYSFAGPS